MSPKACWILINEVYPRLASAIPNNCHVVGSEDHQELIQDATALAARMLDSADRKRKKVTPGNVAYYTILHTKSGRRSVGFSSVDVHGSATQLHGKAKLESFEDPVAMDEFSNEPLALHEVFADEAEDPSVMAARNLDWQAFLKTQDARARSIISCMDEGRCLKEVAVQYRVSDATIQNKKKQIASALVEFMGPDVLKDAAALPAWIDNIHATREKLACREDRRHC